MGQPGFGACYRCFGGGKRMKLPLGRHVFGWAAIGFGLITLVWRDFSTWHQNVPHRYCGGTARI